MRKNPTYDAAAAHSAAWDAGYAAFKRGERLKDFADTSFGDGWIDAALAAREIAATFGNLPRVEIVAALSQSGVAIRSLKPAKPTPSQRKQADSALALIGPVLECLEAVQ